MSIPQRSKVRSGTWRLCAPLIATALLAIPVPALSIDIRAFGACQGAADDSSAIQQAVDAAAKSTTDNIVTFTCMAPVGNGIVVTRLRNAVRIEGRPLSGIKATAVPPSATNSAGSGGPATLLLSACHDCSVTGLTFDGNGMGTILLGILDSERVSIINNTFYNAGSPSAYAPAVLYAIGNIGNTYSGNIVRNSHGRTRGFWIGNSGGGFKEIETNPIITDNTITNTAATGIATLSTGARIGGNFISNTLGAGIVIASTASASSGDAIIENNRVYRNRYHGIQSDSSDGRTTNILVRNNICNENYGAGIYIVEASNWTVSGNIVQDNNFGGTGYSAGIIVQSANGVQILDNVISNTRSGTQRTQTDGISISGRMTAGNIRDVTVSGNVVRNHPDNGIVVNSSPGSRSGAVSKVTLGSNSLDGNARCRVRLFEQGSGSVSGISYLGRIVNVKSSGQICD